MSELQTDDNATPEVVEHQTTETVETSGSDLATDSQGQGEQSGQDSDAEQTQKAINKKHFQFKEEQRRANSLQNELDSIKQTQEQEQLNQQAPAIPSIPDRYEFDSDEEFNREIATRDAAIRQSAEFESQKKMYQNQQQAQQAQAQAEQQRVASEIVAKFNTNAAAQGISMDEVSKISETLGMAGLSANPELAAHIMSQEDGPVMAKYLAANPLEMESLLQANPYQVGTVLSSVSQKAAALKPKQSQAPDPVGTLSGNGANPDAVRHPELEGVVYS